MSSSSMTSRDTVSANSPREGSSRIAAPGDMVVVLFILLALALNAVLAFRININWDEFYFLSFVHDYLRGDLSARFQTFHVHLFSWLPRVSPDEIDQIVAGRLVTAACACLSAFLIYGIARRFLSRTGALYGLLSYLSVSLVVEHGASFRTDPLATLLVLLAVFLLLRRRNEVVNAALAGIAMAAALMVTIKSAFYFAPVAAIVLCTEENWRGRLTRAIRFGLPFAIALPALYLWHQSTLVLPPDHAAATFLGTTASKVLLEDGLFPRWNVFARLIGLNPLFALMVGHGLLLAWRTARRERGGKWERWLPLALALPMATPLFYRNAFEYYYVFILPLAAILTGLTYEHLNGTRSLRPSILPVVALAFPCAGLLAWTYSNLPDRIAPQRTVVAMVHAVFPEPVTYLDGYGVIASFPRVGFFMSSWGMSKYHEAGQAVFPDLVRTTQPPLLLAASPTLFAVFTPAVKIIEERRLLPEDARFLQQNYIQHGGSMLFVAGKHLAAPAAGPTMFDLAIAGTYRLESGARIAIDGRTFVPGDTIALTAGEHQLESGAGAQAVTLRWANALPPPAMPPVDIRRFFGVGQ